MLPTNDLQQSPGGVNAANSTNSTSALNASSPGAPDQDIAGGVDAPDSSSTNGNDSTLPDAGSLPAPEQPDETADNSTSSPAPDIFLLASPSPGGASFTTSSPAAGQSQTTSGNGTTPSGSLRDNAPKGCTGTYTVRAGDRLPDLAVFYKSTVDQVLLVNRQVLDPNNLAAGTVLNIPPCQSLPAPPAAFSVSCATGHCVQPGDTLWSIAVKYDVFVGAILAANQELTATGKLTRQLVIPQQCKGQQQVASIGTCP